MANAAVPQARRDDGFDLPEEAVRGSAASAILRQSWFLALLTAAFAAIVFGFLFFGAARIGAGNLTGRRMRVTQIWTRFLEFLEDQGASVPVISVVVLMLVVALVGGVCLVWVALRVPDCPGESFPEPSSDS